MKKLKEFGRVIVGLLREIADETAYRRYLDARGTVASGVEWRRFSERRLRAKFARAKCC